MENVYRLRREKISRSMEPSSVLVIFSGRLKYRTRDITYPFSTDRDFYYLTGIQESGAVLGVFKGTHHTEERLFVPRYSKLDELLNGEVKEEDYYQEISQINQISFTDFLIESIDQFRQLFGLHTLYICSDPLAQDKDTSEASLFVQNLKRAWPALKVEDLSDVIHQMRTVKSQEEIQAIRRAGELTGTGIRAVMEALKPGDYEYVAQALFEYTVKCGGARQLGFDPVIAGGKNAFALHYMKNGDVVKDGDLLLMDVGAAFEGYSSDVSRTIPVNGRFDEKQAFWYTVCLKAQELMICEMGPGKRICACDEKAASFVAEEMIKGGYIKSEGEMGRFSAPAFAAIRRTYHHLGLDTHDVGSYDGVFQPGMVFAVEPAIYLRAENIGIRIEDDILITESGVEVLTKDIPKEIDEIEKIMRRA